MSLTTCNQHRVQGYALNAGQWVCRGCGLPQSQHETNAQTLARRENEAREVAAA
jgi:hypothetical protein